MKRKQEILESELSASVQQQLSNVLESAEYTTSVIVALSDWLEHQGDLKGSVMVMILAEEFAEHEEKSS